MSTEKTELTGPVSITPDSEARVALELAKMIADRENSVGTKDREYWLTLYYQCRMATANKEKLNAILEAYSPRGADRL
jgi:hypothetical protein